MQEDSYRDAPTESTLCSCLDTNDRPHSNGDGAEMRRGDIGFGEGKSSCSSTQVDACSEPGGAVSRFRPGETDGASYR